MKRILSLMFIATALFIMPFSSCKKEAVQQSALGNGYINSGPLTFQVVQSNWVNYSNEIYVAEFAGILASVSGNGAHKVQVYLTGDGKDLRIDDKVIMYMGNQLWATISANDLRINYRCSAAKIPFSSITIKVEAQ